MVARLLMPRIGESPQAEKCSKKISPKLAPSDGDRQSFTRAIVARFKMI
jgi:hypothetical protein